MRVLRGDGQGPVRAPVELVAVPGLQRGGTLEVEGPTVSCAHCRGTGTQPHVRMACSACGGAGVLTLAGPTRQCPQCGGGGKDHESDLPCSLCNGAGRVREAT